MARRILVLPVLALLPLVIQPTSELIAQQRPVRPPTQLQPRLQKLPYRKPVKSPVSDGVPVVVHLLNRYAQNAPDKTEADRALEKALAQLPNARDLARQLVTNFQKIPIADRRAAYGDLAEPTTNSVTTDRMRSVFTRLAGLKLPRNRVPMQLEIPGEPVNLQKKLKRGGIPEKARPGGASEKDSGPWEARFGPTLPPQPAEEPLQLRFMGVYCREETDWDQSSAADEVYVITDVIDVETREILTLKHPHTSRPSDTYVGVDSGEVRNGPVISMWNGRPRDLTLVTTVLEQDFGDPEHFKDEIDVIVRAGVATVAFFGPPGWIVAGLAELLAPLVTELINDLLDTDDDLIQQAFYYLPAADITRFTHTGTTRTLSRGSRTHVPEYHFYTRHRGDGADYYVMYSIYPFNRPSVEVVPPGGGGHADLVVSRMAMVGTPAVAGATIDVPIQVDVTNRGTETAQLFKVAMELASRGGSPQQVAFAVEGERDPQYPFTRVPLRAGATAAIRGRIRVPLSHRGTTVTFRAVADSCAGEEFMPDYCRVRETNEANNASGGTAVSLPR